MNAAANARSREETRACVPFLERIGVVRRTDNVHLIRNQFPFLSFSLGSDQRTAHADRSAGCHFLNVGIIRQRVARDDLKAFQRRSVIQLNKRKIPGIAPRPDPALHMNGIDRIRRLQNVPNRSWRTDCHWHQIVGRLCETATEISLRHRRSAIYIFNASRR